MSRSFARDLLQNELANLKAESYESLVALVETTRAKEVTGPDGVDYQISAHAHWESRPGGDLVVVVSVSWGLWRNFIPLTGGFFISPDGRVTD